MRGPGYLQSRAPLLFQRQQGQQHLETLATSTDNRVANENAQFHIVPTLLLMQKQAEFSAMVLLAIAPASRVLTHPTTASATASSDSSSRTRNRELSTQGSAAEAEPPR